MSPESGLGDLLKVDPLAQAEKLTGKSYKDDEGTGMLGLLIAISHNQAKREALTAAGDTSFGTKTDEYLRIAEDEGFRLLLAEPFEGSSEAGTDTFYVLWHDGDGILLEFDTYGDHVNGGKFCYNFRLRDPEDYPWDALSSHGWISRDDPSTRYGDHDCREAFRFKLSRLREHFDLLVPWVRPPFNATHLLNYQEWKLSEADRASLAAARLGRLPLDVRQAMGLAAEVSR